MGRLHRSMAADPEPATAVKAARDRLIEAVQSAEVTDVRCSITELAAIEMNLTLLSATKVGRAVKSVLKNSSLGIAHRDAQALLVRWKSLVPDQGQPSAKQEGPRYRYNRNRASHQ